MLDNHHPLSDLSNPTVRSARPLAIEFNNVGIAGRFEHTVVGTETHKDVVLWWITSVPASVSFA